MKIIMLALLAACSFNGKNSNERPDGHKRLYSAPDAEESLDIPRGGKRLIIVGTNDMRGRIEAWQQGARDKHHPGEVLVSVGGVEVLARHLQILRRQNPAAVLTLDAGNALAGGKPEATIEALREMGYDAYTLGMEDLKQVPKRGPHRWLSSLSPAKSEPTLLLSNLVDLHTSEPVKWGNSVPTLLKEVNGVKVGVLGLFTDSVPKLATSRTLNGLYVESALQALLKHTRALRLKGAEVIVLMVDGQLSCGRALAGERKLPVDKVNFDPRAPGACDEGGPLATLLAETPPGLVDVVVSAGDGKVANFVSGIPVVQAFADGTSFSRVDLMVANGKVVEEHTRIHQPVRLCHRFFKATDDCYTGDESVDHRELVPARYLGEAVVPEERITRWITPWREGQRSEVAETDVDEVSSIQAAPSSVGE
jgi:5'-nucleotidase